MMIEQIPTDALPLLKKKKLLTKLNIYSKIKISRHRLVVRTTGFHPVNPGSIPGGGIL